MRGERGGVEKGRKVGIEAEEWTDRGDQIFLLLDIYEIIPEIRGTV